MNRQLYRGWIIACLPGLVLACAACGSRPPSEGVARPTVIAPTGSGLANLHLPAPSELLAARGNSRSASQTPIYTRKGSETDYALVHENTQVDGTRMLFLPQWSKDDPHRGGLAYALYRFDLLGFYGAHAVTFHWRRIGDMGDCIVGIPDFKANRWVFLPGADGTVPLTPTQFTNARALTSDESFVLVILTGHKQWELNSIESGEPAVRIVEVTTNSNPPLSPPTGWPGQGLTLYATTNPSYVSGRTFEWMLGGDNSIWEAHSSWADIHCGSNGTHRCRVVMQSPAGDAELAFNLVVKQLVPPRIDRVEHYSPPVSPPPPGGGPAQLVLPDVHGGYQAETERLTIVGDGGPADEVSWDFGGACQPAVAAGGFTPTLVWGEAGTYTGRVTASNAAGSDAHEFTLIVLPLRPPVLQGVTDLYAQELIPSTYGLDTRMWLLEPRKLYNTGGPIESWDWQFGPGFDHPAHTKDYPEVTAWAPGDYTCFVTAANAAGSSEWKFTIHAAVLPAPDIYNVITQPSTVWSGDTVQFYPHLNQGGPYSTWSWFFGGGCSPNISSSQAPTVQALAPGTYDCWCTASNPKGTDTYNFTLTVN